jgi:hypothetical protein
MNEYLDETSKFSDIFTKDLCTHQSIPVNAHEKTHPSFRVLFRIVMAHLHREFGRY